ncbi:MAG TPA: class I SAM-dependent methyltransferase [Rhabdochlamydiaceae bacterium]|nr:class I SAM-dependent methyltransferase [Rhabdochlamydiaceae bacterium]
MSHRSKNVLYLLSFAVPGGIVGQNIDEVNRDFYNSSGDSFDKFPFETILPDLLMKYHKGDEVLEIGSGAGALAAWLARIGHKVTCIEPAQKLAERAEAKGLKVHCLNIQNFHTEHQYDMVIAISSLIHVPKIQLPLQIEKIVTLLKPQGIFFVNFIEGKTEGFEDPTNAGKMRFFSKWDEKELDLFLSRYFDVLEKHRIYSKKMDCTFLLRLCQVKVFGKNARRRS